MLTVVFSDLIKWPLTSIGPNHPPYNFLPNSVAIIDETEMFIQCPTNLSTQMASYSDYRCHTTVKYLVAIDTSQECLYLYPLFFLEMQVTNLQLNTMVYWTIKYLVKDKGYTTMDLFAQKICFLTIPSFLACGKFGAKEAMESRLIARMRIGVENAIQRPIKFLRQHC